MVVIKSYSMRVNNQGESFIMLHLEGDIEFVPSQKTGNYYARVSKCFISSTFDEDTAKRVLGTALPGVIVKQECEPYEWVPAGSDEVITLNYRHVYQPVEVQPATSLLKVAA